MVTLRVIQRIGKLGAVLSVILVWNAYAADVDFSARLDQNEISEGDTVSLIFTIKTDSRANLGNPEFQAPDFETVGQSSSMSVSAQSDPNSGRFVMVNQQKITKIMRPLKKGHLKITHIQMEVDGQLLKSPDLNLNVLEGGVNPSQGQVQGNSARNGLNGEGKLRGSRAFLRAEVSKNKAYKGEQLILSYYLYHQMKIFNLQPDKLPALTGFLREDLETPLFTSRMESEEVRVNGVPYHRTLLVRYAISPLQEGKLRIDPMSLKFQYYSNSRSQGEDEDPFFGFFQQMAPQIGALTTDPIDLTVLSLPEAGKPSSFTGGIGDYQISASLDRSEVHANEPVTLTLKIQGRGNLSSVQEPKATWPEGVELYDSKGKVTSEPSGIDVKTVEYLLIPRVPGKVDLPPLEFSFFDPQKGQYYTKSIASLSIQVGDPLPGSALVAVKPTTPAMIEKKEETASSFKLPTLRGLKPSESGVGSVISTSGAFPIWRILYWIFLASMSALVGWVASDSLRKRKSPLVQARGQKKTHYSWSDLLQEDRPLLQSYDLLASRVLSLLDDKFQISSKSMSRGELKDLLVGGKKLSPDTWSKVQQLLEYSDMVRFAQSQNLNSEKNAQEVFLKWAQEGEQIEKEISRGTS